MIGLRLLRVALHILYGLIVCALVFPRVPAAARQERVRRWSAQLLHLFRVRVELVASAAGVASAVDEASATNAASAARAGFPAATGDLHKSWERTLVVSNHVSWLDIFIINAVQPCRFVAKSDIRDWPLLGYLCAQSDTIFISRGSPRAVRKTFKSLVASIEGGERVAFFPEGTTAAQGTLLPFHANLFEAAIDARVPIQPLALRYLDAQGSLYAGVDYIGDTTFMQSMLVLLRGPAVQAQVIVLPTIASEDSHRRTLALVAHDHIGAALGYAEPAPAGA
jgi:1-acyl-sn-glycerol-3-phosphate acyltransferase